MNSAQLIENSRPFLDYVVEWKESLPPKSLAEIISGGAEKVAVISVDVINGFCYEGALSSPRVATIVDPIATLFKKSYEAGVRHFILTQDTHPEDSVEFESYPPHCIRGTRESEAVDKFKELPFFDQFQVMPKQSINSAIGTDLDPWLAAHPEVNTFIAVGDCTDLCTYQLAMHLKLRGNARNEKVRVIVPVDCVDTYDLPVSVAAQIGAVPHDGDLLHYIFLYHMRLNGVEVVAKID
ncbi:MAG: cysteine hydrolase [Anaerolineae bacterium]|nr:cysteine hydrolase [Anaerolineales bacterium]MCQ3974906.1 cysteine hydrolase [Anaerolineae bacterium]